MSSSLKYVTGYACPCLQSMMRTFKIFFVIFKSYCNFSTEKSFLCFKDINRCSGSNICMELATTLLHTAKLIE